MGRYDERYTEEQRTAVGRALLEPDPITGRKVTAPEAIDRLMDGRLGVPAPPDRMPNTTAYTFRDRERARQQGHELSPLAKEALADPVQVNERLAQRLVSMYERQLDKAEEQMRKGKLDPALFRLLTQTFRDVSASVRKPDPRKPGTHKTPAIPKDHGPKPEDTVRKLLGEHQRTSRGTNGHSAATPCQPQPHSIGRDSAARATSTALPPAPTHA